MSVVSPRIEPSAVSRDFSRGVLDFIRKKCESLIVAVDPELSELKQERIAEFEAFNSRDEADTLVRELRAFVAHITAQLDNP